MNKSIYILGKGMLMVLILSACSPDCKDITLKKPKWITTYETYWVEKDTVEASNAYIDTIASYSLVKHQTEKEYKKNHKGTIVGASTTHYITIKNNSDFSGSFAVKIEGKQYDEKSQTWKDLDYTTSYQKISPQQNTTFYLTHSSWWRNETSDYHEDNVSFHILQAPSSISKTVERKKTIKRKEIRRIDDLIYVDTIVSNCECDIDALKAEYKAIEDIYTKLKQENLIK